MRRRFLRRVHPSWCFYAAVWGVIVGIVLGWLVGEAWIYGTLWLVAAVVLLIVSLYWPCVPTALLAILAGVIIGNYRVDTQLAGRGIMANLQGQEVVLLGKLTDDPDMSAGAAVVKMSHLQVYLPAEPVENYDALVENFAKSVEKSLSLVENSAADVENYGTSVDNSGENVEKPPNSLAELADFYGFTSVAGEVYTTIAGKAELERSDLVLISGKMQAGFGTYVGKMYRAKLLTAERAGVGDIFAQFKRGFAERVYEYICSPEADLGMGYLMGVKSGLPEDLAETLQLVGMTHVVVASGAHLAILTDAAKKLFGKISKFAGTLVALLMILLFVLIVGFTPSMTRAALVASLSLLAGYVGRKFTPLRLIGLVAMITLMINPTYLLNLGWQLSFASFFGILVLAPRLTTLFYGGKEPPWLASMLITSVSTSLICGPVLIYNFGSLSFLALVANLVILPTLPYAMLLMLLTGLASFWPLLARIIAIPTTWLLDLHIWLVNFLSEQSAFIINPPAEDVRIYLLYIPVLIFLVAPVVTKFWQNKHKQSRQKRKSMLQCS